MNNFAERFGSISLFIIYFWFGLLKVLGLSPASQLVHDLFDKTMGVMIPGLSFGTFMIMFAIFEMVIGIMFVIPKFRTAAIVLFALHMVTTTAPLFLVSGIWEKAFVPTLEGQYIIKNLALISVVLFLWRSRKWA